MKSPAGLNSFAGTCAIRIITFRVCVFVILIFIIGICFEFRYSYFVLLAVRLFFFGLADIFQIHL